jgi:hypothetical protein
LDRGPEPEQLLRRHGRRGAYRVDPRQDVFLQLGTGILRGYIPVFGVKVVKAWYQLDGEGVSGWAQDDPRNRTDTPNHAVHADGIKRSVKYGHKLRVPGSWGQRFGWNGVSYVARQHVRNRNDAFLIKGMQEVPQNAPPTV